MNIKLLFTDNLISRNRARWNPKEIQKLTRLIVGKGGILDHDWGNVSSRWGIVTSAKAVKSAPPDDLSPEEKATIDKEGYWYAECDVEVAIANVEAKSWVAEMIGNLLFSEVSIGFSYKFMRCPDCVCSAGDMRSPKCPNSWEDISYYERIGAEEIFEISFVTIPDVKRCRILEINGISAKEYLRGKTLPEQ